MARDEEDERLLTIWQSGPEPRPSAAVMELWLHWSREIRDRKAAR